MKDKIRVLISEEEIKNTVKRLADEINNFYKEDDDVIAVGILKGCFVFMADIIRQINCDPRICFMEVSSYGNGSVSTGTINIKKDIDVDITDKNILIIEDIIDSGNTLNSLVAYFKEKNPKSVKVCTLLSKPSRRQVEFEADYTGFVIEDRFIVGYGLDYGEKYRSLPFIAEVETND